MLMTYIYALSILYCTEDNVTVSSTFLNATSWMAIISLNASSKDALGILFNSSTTNNKLTNCIELQMKK